MLSGTDGTIPALPVAFQATLISFGQMGTGAGEFVGGVLFGRITDKYGRTTTVVLGALVGFIAYALAYINLVEQVITPNVGLGIFGAFLLGAL